MTTAHGAEQPAPAGSGKARVIAITSGKGGVGKSSLALNLAIELRKRGQRVCLLDADTNLANITILAGLVPSHHLQHYLQGAATLDQLIVRGPEGVEIIASASGLADLVDPATDARPQYRELVQQLERGYDFLLIDTAAGLEQNVLTFLALAAELILVITPEPTSLTDAFSLLKVLRPQRQTCAVRIVINRVGSYAQAQAIFRRFAAAVRKYTGLAPRPLGYLFEDAQALRAVMTQTPFVLGDRRAPVSRCVRHIAKLLHEQPDRNSGKGLQHWQQRFLAPGPGTTTGPGTTAEQAGLLTLIDTLPEASAAALVTRVNEAWRQRRLDRPTRRSSSNDALRAAMTYARRLR